MFDLQVGATDREIRLWYTDSGRDVHPPELTKLCNPSWRRLLALAESLSNDDPDGEGIDVELTRFLEVDDCRWQLLLTTGLVIRRLTLKSSPAPDSSVPLFLSRFARPCQPLRVCMLYFTPASKDPWKAWDFLHDVGVLANPRTTYVDLGLALCCDGARLSLPGLQHIKVTIWSHASNQRASQLLQTLPAQLVRPLVGLTLVSNNFSYGHQVTIDALLTGLHFLNVRRVVVMSKVRVPHLSMDILSAAGGVTATETTSLITPLDTGVYNHLSQCDLDAVAARHSLSHVHMGMPTAELRLPLSVVVLDVMIATDGASANEVAAYFLSSVATCHPPLLLICVHQQPLDFGTVHRWCSIRYFAKSAALAPWPQMRLFLRYINPTSDLQVESTCRRQGASVAYGSRAQGMELPGFVMRMVMMYACQALVTGQGFIVNGVSPPLP